MPQPGETMEQGGQRYRWTGTYWEPVDDLGNKTTTEDGSPFIPPASKQEAERERQARASGFWNRQAAFGERMRQGAMRPTQGAQGFDTRGVEDARQLGMQSYGMQRGALGQIRDRAQGGGPSVAALQGIAQQDALNRGLAGAEPGALRSALFSNQAGANVAQAGAQRGAEINQAQDLWGSGAAQMRGQSLEDYQQGLSNAFRTGSLNLQQQNQNIERELAMQKLGLAGLQGQAAFQSDLDDTFLGMYQDQMARGMQQFGAWTGLGSGAAAGLSRYGISEGYEVPKPGGYRGGKTGGNIGGGI